MSILHTEHINVEPAKPIKQSTMLHHWTYWGCISEAFYCLKYSSSNSSHGEGSPTVVHNPPGATKSINYDSFRYNILRKDRHLGCYCATLFTDKLNAPSWDLTPSSGYQYLVQDVWIFFQWDSQPISWLLTDS